MTPEERMEHAIEGFEGGGDGFYGEDDRVFDQHPVADPMEAFVARVAKIDDNLWEEEEIKEGQIPEELKESGAIAVSLKGVGNTIGKDREEWNTALDNEMES